MSLRRWVGACVLGAALAGVGLPAQALKFRWLQQGSVLLVYDCGAQGFDDEPKGSCHEYETQFAGPGRYANGDTYQGDAAALERLLSQNSDKIRQVWLSSGGGNLDEGVKVGELLRRFNSYVFVPPGGFCVSACTVAFLGGRIRDVDEKGSYQVHAYSRFLDVSAADLQALGSEDGEFALAKLAQRSAEGARSWAIRLHQYVQRMIGGRPDPAALEQVMRSAPDFYAGYVKSPQFRADLDRIRKEGAVSAQDVLMRLERESFSSQLEHIAGHAPELGARAMPAVEILRIMFASRITSTYSIDPLTLKEKGYVNVRH